MLVISFFGLVFVLDLVLVSVSVWFDFMAYQRLKII